MRSHRLFAAVYDRLNGPLECEVLAPLRAELLRDLEGEVLEVGAGTGAGLRHFDRAARVVAVEPDRAMRRRLGAKVAEARVRVEIADAPAESLPFPSASFDAVVFAARCAPSAIPIARWPRAGGC